MRIHLGQITRDGNLIAALRQIQIEPRDQNEHDSQNRNEKIKPLESVNITRYSYS